MTPVFEWCLEHERHERIPACEPEPDYEAMERADDWRRENEDQHLPVRDAWDAMLKAQKKFKEFRYGA